MTTKKKMSSKYAEDIASLKTDVDWLKKKMRGLDDQVTNHIPTQMGKMENNITDEIKSLRKVNKKDIEKIKKDLDTFQTRQLRWIIGILVGVATLLGGTIVNYVTSI